MQHTILDFGGAALVPELGTDVAAGAAGNVQLALVAVMAVRAFPHQLAVIFHNLDFTVIAAHLAVVALGVQLGVHDVIIDELHHFDDSFQVILHIGHFHIADGAARRQALEFALELQLGERIDLFGYMHMVAVGDIVAVRNARHNAKPLLQALGKLVGGGFQRGAVQRVINIFSVFPLVALIVHVLHHAQGKGFCGGVGMALAGHIFAAFIQARIAQADGGVAAVQQLINGLALFQAGQSAVLPQDGCRIGQGTLKAVMAVLQGAVAQFQALIKNFPEFIRLTAGGQGHIRQVMVTTP